MPIPASISELSTTPGSNSPSGSDSPSVLDDHQRTAYAFIKTLSDTKAATADAVLLTGNQTVAGIKTFSSTPVVPDDSFTFAKLQDIATARFLGRTTAGSGDVEELTASGIFTAIKQAATDSATGVVELSTDAEAQAGTDATRAVTPDNLGATVIGIGQTWQNVIGSRLAATNYTNDTGRPIMVCVSAGSVFSAGSATMTMTVGGVVVASTSTNESNGAIFQSRITLINAIVPNGAVYRVDGVTGALTIAHWTELRV